MPFFLLFDSKVPGIGELFMRDYSRIMAHRSLSEAGTPHWTMPSLDAKYRSSFGQFSRHPLKSILLRKWVPECLVQRVVKRHAERVCIFGRTLVG
jgi:hypothetical protein